MERWTNAGLRAMASARRAEEARKLRSNPYDRESERDPAFELRWEEKPKRLVNCSNHPSAGWSDEQKGGWDEIIDVPFPNVPPDGDGEDLFYESLSLAQTLVDSLNGEPGAVFIAGEMTTVFIVVTILQQSGIRVISATTRRVAVENPETGEKISQFRFSRWRKFPSIGKGWNLQPGGNPFAEMD